MDVPGVGDHEMCGIRMKRSLLSSRGSTPCGKPCQSRIPTAVIRKRMTPQCVGGVLLQR